MLVFFVLYQQFENHLLQPLIFARTVKLNPLTVLVSILIGVEMAGILGALLAIPVAGHAADHRPRRVAPAPGPAAARTRGQRESRTPISGPGPGPRSHQPISIPPISIRSPWVAHTRCCPVT